MSASGNLAARLRERIERDGPISFCEWMKAALYDEREGYYSAGRVRQGRSGDYRTAPETSPLFAATFARYFSKLHTDLNRPRSWTLFEIGAGGGEFAYGVLSHMRDHLPEVFAATLYVIDEISAATRDRAANHLAEFADRVSFQSLDEISDPLETGIIFSNELIDAFPVHRVVMHAGDLRELCVGVNETGFTWVVCDLNPAVADYCARAEMRLAEGQVAEVNLKAEEFVSRAASFLNRGYVITVDYGAEREELWGAPDRRLGTLRAFHRHQFVDDLLAMPGQHDLTSTIDWTQIREAGDRFGLRAIKFQRLDEFLGSEGMYDVLVTLTNQMKDAVEVIRLSTSARELVLPTGLAASFQVLVQEKVAK
jgi:SAM-dependent MidA family methyltransferase